MLVEHAIDIMGRSRHPLIFIKCLKHKDGMTYRELYVAYCKRCEQEDIKPNAYTSMYNIMRLEVARGSVIKEHFHIPGNGTGVRIWLVK